jgi:hypothetical protein
MSLIKKIIAIFICFLSYVSTYASNDLRWEIVDFNWNYDDTTIIWDWWTWDWLWLLDGVIKYFKDSVFGLLYIIVVGIFVYMWAKLVMARWKPDQFKKIWIQLMHIVIWIFIVTWAWAVVKIVSRLSF